MRTLIYLLLFSIQFQLSNAQSGVISLLTLESDGGEDFHITYKVKEGDTAFGLSQRFQHSIEALSDFNEFDLSTIKKYTKVKIPFNNSMLSEVTEETNSAFIYMVKPQETLYTIAKKYFNLDVDQIKKWNNLKDNNIKVGSSLIVGYAVLNSNNKTPSKTQVSRDQKTEEDKEEVNVPTASNSTSDLTVDELLDLLEEEVSNQDTKFEEQVEVIEYTDEKGLAFTENVKLESSELFVLHPLAKVNSDMEIHYPMLNTTVKAKVISVMPKELYPKNISVVISPSVAEALGAKDDQFRVEMKYVTD